MRRFPVLARLALVALLLVPGLQAWAQGSDDQPVTVTLKVDSKVVLHTCKGLKVRITNNQDDFMGHSFFISEADVKAVAKKRKVKFAYDAARQKLTLGTETRPVVPPDPKGTDSFAFGKVRMVTYQGKPYFEVGGLYSGLGFNSCSKMKYGFTMSAPSKK